MFAPGCLPLRLQLGERRDVDEEHRRSRRRRRRCARGPRSSRPAAARSKRLSSRRRRSGRSAGSATTRNCGRWCTNQCARRSGREQRRDVVDDEDEPDGPHDPFGVLRRPAPCRSAMTLHEYATRKTTAADGDRPLGPGAATASIVNGGRRGPGHGPTIGSRSGRRQERHRRAHPFPERWTSRGSGVPARHAEAERVRAACRPESPDPRDLRLWEGPVARCCDGAVSSTEIKIEDTRGEAAGRHARDIARVARDVFGWDPLRPGIEAAVAAVLDGQDVLARDADGLRQVRGLPARRRAAAGLVARRLAADRAAGRPGRVASRTTRRRPAGARSSTRASASAPSRRPGRCSTTASLGYLFVAPERFADDAVVEPARGARRSGAARRRRGALRLELGPRLPARLPAARRGRRAAAPPRRRPRSAARPHRDRVPAGSGGDPRAPADARRPRAHPRVRPAEHRTSRVRARVGGTTRSPPCSTTSPSCPQPGLLYVATRRATERFADRAPRARHRRRRLPRRAAREAAAGAVGGLPRRRGRRRRRDERVRHGHRQGRRAVRRARRDPGVARRVLPGGRPRRPRRAAGRREAALPARRTSGSGGSSAATAPKREDLRPLRRGARARSRRRAVAASGPGSAAGGRPRSPRCSRTRASPRRGRPGVAGDRRSPDRAADGGDASRPRTGGASTSPGSR